jgi:hypothetical protein
MGRYYVKRNGVYIGGGHVRLQAALDAAKDIAQYGGPVQVVDSTSDGDVLKATFEQEDRGHAEK